MFASTHENWYLQIYAFTKIHVCLNPRKLVSMNLCIHENTCLPQPSKIGIYEFMHLRKYMFASTHENWYLWIYAFTKIHVWLNPRKLISINLCIHENTCLPQPTKIGIYKFMHSRKYVCLNPRKLVSMNLCIHENTCLPQPTKIGIYKFMHSRKYMFASTHENWYLQIYAFTKIHVCLNPRKLVSMNLCIHENTCLPQPTKIDIYKCMHSRTYMFASTHENWYLWIYAFTKIHACLNPRKLVSMNLCIHENTCLPQPTKIGISEFMHSRKYMFASTHDNWYLWIYTFTKIHVGLNPQKLVSTNLCIHENTCLPQPTKIGIYEFMHSRKYMLTSTHENWYSQTDAFTKIHVYLNPRKLVSMNLCIHENTCLPQPTKIGIYKFMHSRKYMFASTHENWYLQIYAFTKIHVCLNPRKLVSMNLCIHENTCLPQPTKIDIYKCMHSRTYMFASTHENWYLWIYAFTKIHACLNPRKLVSMNLCIHENTCLPQPTKIGISEFMHSRKYMFASTHDNWYLWIYTFTKIHVGLNPQKLVSTNLCIHENTCLPQPTKIGIYEFMHSRKYMLTSTHENWYSQTDAFTKIHVYLNPRKLVSMNLCIHENTCLPQPTKIGIYEFMHSRKYMFTSTHENWYSQTDAFTKIHVYLNPRKLVSMNLCIHENTCLPQPTKIGIHKLMHSRKYMFASTNENWYLQIYAFTKINVCLNPRKLVSTNLCIHENTCLPQLTKIGIYEFNWIHSILYLVTYI